MSTSRRDGSDVTVKDFFFFFFFFLKCYFIKDRIKFMVEGVVTS